MDDIDRHILNMIQESFPVTQRPFEAIGDQVGISEKDALDRVRRLKEESFIRRIGPVLEPKKLVYVSTLCGVHVEEDILADVIKDINRHKGVTHNYERDGDLNVWFTITTKTEADINAFLCDLQDRFGLTIFRFPKKRVFKIKTIFPV